MTIDTIHVLVCTYQGERFIAEQLDSILKQTYPSIEIYVFDDCSNDNTPKIIRTYCERYDSIHLHENKKNIGFLKNFENAISGCSGRYIALCDQDDIWHPEKLDKSMKAIKALEKKHPQMPAMIHTDLSLIDNIGKILSTSFFEKKKVDLPPEKSLSRIMGHCGVMGNTILMNGLLADKALPFPDGLKYHDYWLALINELFGVRTTLSEPLVQYRIHDRNISNNKSLAGTKTASSTHLRRDYLLPFMEDNRGLAISHLLTKCKLSPEDKSLVSQFYEYLMFKGKRLPYFIFLLKNDFLKSNFSYRVSVFYRLMLTIRYNSKTSL